MCCTPENHTDPSLTQSYETFRSARGTLTTMAWRNSNLGTSLLQQKNKSNEAEVTNNKFNRTKSTHAIATKPSYKENQQQKGWRPNNQHHMCSCLYIFCKLFTEKNKQTCAIMNAMTTTSQNRPELQHHQNPWNGGRAWGESGCASMPPPMPAGFPGQRR